MHDLDRSLFEVGPVGGTGEAETFGATTELEEEDFLETLETVLGEVSGEQVELEAEQQEINEVELATQLLEVGSQGELDRFIGALFRRAVGAAKNFAGTPTGQALVPILKQAAKDSLPVLGRAVGERIAPGRGGVIGSRVATAAGNLFGLELEGLSNEDAEFETARAFVRFADAAVRNAASAAPAVPPQQAAGAAVRAAAREHAPGLLRAAGGARGRRARSGRWARQGNAIVVYL
jgi:hypothetical protein